jgi:hypothetical protein
LDILESPIQSEPVDEEEVGGRRSGCGVEGEKLVLGDPRGVGALLLVEIHQLMGMVLFPELVE